MCPSRLHCSIYMLLLCYISRAAWRSLGGAARRALRCRSDCALDTPAPTPLLVLLAKPRLRLSAYCARASRVRCARKLETLNLSKSDVFAVVRARALSSFARVCSVLGRSGASVCKCMFCVRCLGVYTICMVCVFDYVRLLCWRLCDM